MKKRVKRMLIWAGAILAVLIVALGAWAIWQKMSQPKEPEEVVEEPIILEPNTAYGVQMTDKCYYEFQNFIKGYSADYSGCMQDIDLNEEYCSGYDPDTQALSNINAVVILDSSGSMTGLVNSKQRIDIAKDAVSKFLMAVPKGVNTGLVVYGHKGSNNYADKELSCNGIEEVVKLGANNSSSIISAMKSFSPRGWTPIAGALDFAKDIFSKRSKSDGDFLILVSDGIESCDGDPLDSAQKLKSEIKNIELDVIGFAADNATRTFLNNVAVAANGSYITANKADDITEELNKQLAKIKIACIRGTIRKIYLRNEANNLSNLNCWLQSVKHETDKISQGVLAKSISSECVDKITQAVDTRQKEFFQAKDDIAKKNEAIYKGMQDEAESQLRALGAYDRRQ
jgi:Ca-activated chloride channel family protein